MNKLKKKKKDKERKEKKDCLKKKISKKNLN